MPISAFTTKRGPRKTLRHWRFDFVKDGVWTTTHCMAATAKEAKRIMGVGKLETKYRRPVRAKGKGK